MSSATCASTAPTPPASTSARPASLFRTEFGTVVVQEDICNGCGYCVPACPFGVIDQRQDDGRAWKCTLCYDRLEVGMEPACAQGVPDRLDPVRRPRRAARARATAGSTRLHDDGVADARLYGHDPDDGVGGAGAFFLLLDEPEVYGLPPDPVVTTRDLPAMWRNVGVAAVTLAGGASWRSPGDRDERGDEDRSRRRPSRSATPRSA